MTDDTSAADPQAPSAYAEAGPRIDAALEASATRPAGVLAEFADTCREYPLDADFTAITVKFRTNVQEVIDGLAGSTNLSASEKELVGDTLQEYLWDGTSLVISGLPDATR